VPRQRTKSKTTLKAYIRKEPMTIEVKPESLPRYRHHKVVRAAKIASLDTVHNRVFLEGDRVTYGVGPAFFGRAQAGGYLVVHNNGHTSYLPAVLFEEEYSQIDHYA
jgi:hypothetical protein